MTYNKSQERRYLQDFEFTGLRICCHGKYWASSSQFGFYGKVLGKNQFLKKTFGDPICSLPKTL